jgi:GAF domain-containing protein
MEAGNHPPHRAGSAPREVAIVGLNRETAELLPSLLEAPGIRVARILNPDVEDPGRLTQHPHLEVIIDTTGNPVVAARLRRLPLKHVDVISGLSARILFCSLRGAAAQGAAAERREHVSRCLQEVRDTLSGAHSREEALRVILGTAVKTAWADAGSVMILDPSRRQLTIEAAVGLADQVVLATAQRVDRGISGAAIRRREPILTQGPADRAAFGMDHQRPELVSSVCCPMLFEGEPLGVINISSRTPSRVFGEEDVAFLRDLAGLAAEMLKSSREADANQHTAHAATLMASVREILSLRHRFEERLNLLLMKMANAFGANVCAYYEYSAEDGLFVARASSEDGERLPREKPRFLDDFFAQRVLKTDNTFCVNAAGKTPRTKKWQMLQPIRHGQDLEGALLVQLSSEKNSLKEEGALLRRIGEMLAREVGRNREMEAIKAKNLKHAAVSQYAADIQGAPTLEDLVRMTLASARHILEAETCVLRLRTGPEGELRVFDTLSQRNPAWLRDIVALDDLIVGDMGPGTAAALFPDLRESPYNVDLLGSESAVAVALSAGGELLGTLSLYDKTSDDLSGRRSFGEADREVLLAFGQTACRGLKRFHPFPSAARPMTEAA